MRKTIKMFFSCLYVIGLAMMICACGKSEEIPLEAASEEEPQETETETTAEEIKSDGAVVVYVCGEVNAPGVYELPSGSRLYQAIDAAGGMTDTAADTYLNQAEALNDGQSIYVPSVEEAATWAEGTETGGGTAPAAASGSTEDGKVNINTAAMEELMTLSGIGEAKASSIIEYRETNGKFQSIEEIKNIPGIKDGVFQKIKDQISV